jgi:signal transduction histidine kinase
MPQLNTPPKNNEAHLRAVIEEYEKKLADAAELVARVRHEINNPLAALLGQAQLLLREELSERARKRAETIESQARRIQTIVGELREVQLPASAINNQD